MFLQMYLFHELRNRGASPGFSKRVRLDKRRRVSSVEELLKCWTLLLNFGHLEGTFECERAWFELLKEDQELFNKFLECLPDDACRGIARKYFDDENYYKFHEMLVLLFLKYYEPRHQTSAYPVDMFILMIKRFLVDAPKASTIKRCKAIFRRVRKIAYIILDSTFFTSYVKINPKVFFDYIFCNSDDVLYEDYSNFNKTLDSISLSVYNDWTLALR